MKKNFLISTGGSGGHVIPATILYKHLSSVANIVLSTDKRGLKYFNNDHFKFEIINTPKLNNIFFLPINFILITILTFRSYFLLKNKEIEKIFSTGGYMSLPLILAAKLLRLKIYLVEPNQVLGRANKFFLNSCEKIFCYTNEIKNFPIKFKDKIITIFPLVKENIYKLKQSDKNKDKFTLLVVGGSQGANIFDKNLKNLIVKISKEVSIKIIQQTHQSNISDLKNFYTKNNVKNEIFNFDENFAYNIIQSDLCISRAGASTLAELSVLNIPFIAVPLPDSKGNHQYENALFYEMKNCCWIVEQNQFEEKIEKVLKDIFYDKSNYFKKKESLKKLNFQNTWTNVNQKILKTINEN
tara:strand:- start:197 stop:1261 length:1065 start_codon:yes stop_codon:yes gene_type:complete